ncbi:MAG: hypothetical protein DHS20C16_18060 [Phycisphaerae bacterium]|nr:MAG: hypothetical protein DHS20C16_18060 [Phycisphaerae bacterium]
MKHRRLSMGFATCAMVGAACAFQTFQANAENLHFTYLWHLEQPIYWPDQQPTGADHYEDAWMSIQRTDLGAAHPENNLRDIFGWADRVAAYQYRCADAISAISGYPEAGAQISYSGGLIKNVASLGAANQLGYGSNWASSLSNARGWNTVGQSKPRCDIVVFPFHHPLLPLCDEATVRKEIQLYKAAYAGTWGSSPGISKGLFPPEMAFSTRIVQVLAEEGIEWVIVSGEHVSRACADFPTVLGTGGINCDPPNAADQLNPAQVNYFRKQIDRGCSPATAMPFGYTPHRVQHIDPNTGQVYSVVAVPAAQALGWDDGYSPLGIGSFDTLNAYNEQARPMLALLAHDGDNAWGGGFSYYMEATPNLVNTAQAAGYTATVIEEYLADHPVPAGDVIHVEDGAWVNADGDFGAPQMLNWNWPLVSGGAIDIPGGWAEDERNWAVITAAQNRVETAEQIAGSADINEILNPGASTSAVERAWHYFLGSLNSGYMYYGTVLDMEVKPTVACNEAVEHADTVIGDGSLDTTAPTIWIPQRHPWNPGSVNFGPQYGYQQFVSDGDFWIWTFAYDVSDIASVTLKYRIDVDGTNPLASSQNETYAGGAQVGPWQSLTMTYRDFPAGNVNNDPSINFFEMPQYIADEYYVEVQDLREVLLDYYVEAVDGKGNIKRSPIQHVYIGDGVGGGGTGGDVVTVTPEPPQAGGSATISYDPAGRVLESAGQVYIHYGFNGWDPTIAPDPAMTWNPVDSVWEITVPVSSSASVLDVVFNDGASTWDNNGGADWHVVVEGGVEPAQQWDLDGQLDANATLIDSNAGMVLHAGVTGDQLYIAGLDARGGNDHFLLVADTPGPMGSAPWSKAGQVAGWSAFVGNENDSGWSGWFDQAGQADVVASGGTGFLEATINLADEFGVMPDVIYVAFAAYPSADASSLLSAMQVPASTNGDGNIDGAEYIAINTCDIRIDHDVFDLDRNCAFNLADYEVFVDCFAGPENGSLGTCPANVDSDFDQDGDTDLADFALMQPNLFE